MRNLDSRRVLAVIRKELRDYRRKRAVVVTMAVFPVLFMVQPIISLFLVPVSSLGDLHTYVVLPLLYLLLIPTIMPSTLAAYTIAGEREQGTLEPLLTTPIRQQELILGKAGAVMIPTLVLAYSVYAIFLVCVELFANAAIASAVFHQGPVLLGLVLFAPLLAGWAVVVGMGVSVRANEVRVAQQLGVLASFPPIGLIVLLAVGVVRPTFFVSLEFAVGLLVIDWVALRLVSRMFDRERLVTGVKAVRS
jgi:ABC-type Na+ efflux pump permease subunit